MRVVANLLGIATGIAVLAGLVVALESLAREDYYYEKAVEAIGPEPIIPEEVLRQLNPEPKYKEKYNLEMAEDFSETIHWIDMNSDIEIDNKNAKKEHSERAEKLQNDYSREWHAAVMEEEERIQRKIIVAFALIGIIGSLVSIISLRNIYRDYLRAALSNAASDAARLASEASSIGSLITTTLSKRRIKAYQDEHDQARKLLESGFITKDQFNAKHEELKLKIQQEQDGSKG